MGRLTPEKAGDMTMELVRGYTPTLVPGKEYSRDVINSYHKFYAGLLGMAKELGGNKVYSRIWSLEGRPVLAASNHDNVPEHPHDLHNWNVDLLMLVHADVKPDSPDAAEHTYVRNGFVHGPGGGDNKWNAIPGIVGLTQAPEEANVVMLVYTNEERGGRDIAYLVEEGLSPKIILCGDGAPIPLEENALISIVPKGRGGFRAHLTISKREAFHSGRVRLAQQPLIPFAFARFIHDLEQEGGPGLQDPTIAAWEEATCNITMQVGDDISATPSDGLMTVEMRAGTEEKIAQAEAVTSRLADKHGITFDVFERSRSFLQSMEDPALQAFIQSAQEAAGPENVIFPNDGGASDMRHFGNHPKRILVGVKGEKWHVGGSAQRVSIDSILAHTKAFPDFIQKVPQVIGI